MVASPKAIHLLRAVLVPHPTAAHNAVAVYPLTQLNLLSFAKGLVSCTRH